MDVRDVEHLGATLPGPAYKNWQALLMEIVLTAAAGERDPLAPHRAAQNVGAIAALAVGAYIALAGLWASSGQRRLDEPGPILRPRPGQR